MVTNMAYNIAMKMANLADFKNRLSYFISLVEKGEEIEICKRNVPVARVTPLKNHHGNKTVLGCGRKSVTFLSDDLFDPFIPEEHWDMLS